MSTVLPLPARNRIATRRAGAATGACLLLPLCGCGGGSSATPPVVSIQPVAPLAIDGGQTSVLTARVSGEGSAMGVSWSVGCPGAAACGSMQSATSASGAANYFQSVVSSSAQMIQITATSQQDPIAHAVVGITVNPPPQALAVAPQTATVGVAFSLVLTPFVQGGTPPYTCLPAAGALPAGLAFNFGNQIFGTPTTVMAPVTSSYACNDSANPPVFTTSPLAVSIQVLAPGADDAASLLRAPRYGRTATLLPGGKVLLAGGANPELTQVCELYDPETGKFAPTGTMTIARGEHTATALADGEVLIVGGNGVNGQPLASAEIFDPGSGTFSPTGRMALARAQHAAALLNDGRVLITGGTDGSTALASAEIFDPATGEFSGTGSMGLTRRWHTATTLTTGQVLVTGGDESSEAHVAIPLSSAELYDPGTGSFVATGSMGSARARHIAMARPDGTVLVVSADTACCAPSRGIGSLDNCGATLLDVPTASIELYSPASGRFAPYESLVVAHTAHTATPPANLAVLVRGGESTVPYAFTDASARGFTAILVGSVLLSQLPSECITSKPPPRF